MDAEWKGRTLGSILFDSRMIGQAEIERALDEQKRSGMRFGEALVKLGLVSREDVGWGLSHQLNIPFVRIQNELIDPEAVRITPEEMARRHQALPYLLIGDELTIVVEDPTDRRAVAEIAAIAGKRVIIGVGLAEEISAALDLVYGPAAASPRTDDLRSPLFEPARVAAMTADATGAQFVDALLAAALERRAASVHFAPQRGEVQVSFRVGGEMTPAATLGRAWMHVVNRRLKSLLRQSDRRAGALEGSLPFAHAGRDVLFHASFIDTVNGEAIVLANVDAPEIGETFASLALDDDAARTLALLLAGRRGLLALTGPEHPAKYKFLRLLAESPPVQNRKRVAVGRWPYAAGADLIQLRRAAGRAAPLDALDAAVALDPDVLAIDDLMDRPLLDAALKEAAGARLVLGVLRLPTLAAGLEYLLENAESRVLLCAALRSVLSFHLARALTQENSVPDDRRDLAVRALRLTAAEARAATLRRAAGPPGPADRWRALVGLLPLDGALAALAKSGAPRAQVVEAAQAAGSAAAARAMTLRGEIGLDDYLIAAGSQDDGAA